MRVEREDHRPLPVEVREAPADRFDVERIREDFPILQREVRGRRLVYLDSGATTQKPRAVMDAVARFYEEENANVHRGVYLLAEEATRRYEEAREKVRRFIHARDSREVLFVRGTTEGINLVAQTWGRRNVGPGDQVLVTTMEHHSNLVPWQMLCDERGADLVAAPINEKGELLLEDFERLLGPRTRLVAVAHASNALGTVNPVKELARMAHARGAVVLVDGAQGPAHLGVDVQDMDCDFYAFSGHKMYGPTGIGVLYGKEALLEAMPPWQGGGDMILSVSFEKTVYNRLPYKFEAGTPDICGAVGLGAAIDYLESVGLEGAAAHERDLLGYATRQLSRVPGLRLIGTAREKIGVLSFVLKGVHAHDAGTVLDQRGIAVRTGHHCAMPLMQQFGIAATVRASLGLYNTRDEIDALVEGLAQVREVFH